MKLTDFLQDVGRPVAYYPELRKITGSTNATILLCQFIYWRGKESDPEGWLYKTSDDIQSETGLSYGEQKTARRDLVEAGLLAEHYARLDHQMKFKLNLDTINDKWGKPQTDIPESGKPTLGNDAKPLSLNESETTPETTPEKDIRFSKTQIALEKIGILLTSTDPMKIDAWMEKHTDDKIQKAIDITQAKGVRNISYVNTILAGWLENGYPDDRKKQTKPAEPKAFDGVRQYLEGLNVNSN